MDSSVGVGEAKSDGVVGGEAWVLAAERRGHWEMTTLRDGETSNKPATSRHN